MNLRHPLSSPSPAIRTSLAARFRQTSRPTLRWRAGVTLSLLLASSLGVAQNDEALAVTVVMPTGSVLTQELRLSGTLMAERRASLSPRVDGLVAQVMVDAGDQVRMGDLLLQQDAALAEKTVQRAEAEAAQAQANYQETQRLVREAQRLVEGRHLPQTELATREAALAAAQAQVAAAQAVVQEQRELLKRHQLPAPFTGVIATKMTEAGEWVTRGTPVLELVATDRIRLDLEAPQERFPELLQDTPVRVQPDALPGVSLSGRIVALVPVANALARSFLVRVVVDDPQHRLLPGTSATAMFDLSSEIGQAVLVPRDALLRHPDGSFSLFTVAEENGRQVARRHQVSIGRQGRDGVEVLSGLPAEVPVVIRGNEVLQDGQTVKVLQDS